MTKRKAKRLKEAQEKRAINEVKIEAQRAILKGQRNTVREMEQLLSKFESEQKANDNIIEALYEKDKESKEQA